VNEPPCRRAWKPLQCKGLGFPTAVLDRIEKDLVAQDVVVRPFVRPGIIADAVEHRPEQDPARPSIRAGRLRAGRLMGMRTGWRRSGQRQIGVVFPVVVEEGR